MHVISHSHCALTAMSAERRIQVRPMRISWLLTPRLTMRTFTSIAAVVAAAVSSVCAAQVPLHALASTDAQHDVGNSDATRVLTPEFDKFVREVVANGSVPGLTLGIVHPGGKIELGAWGRRTEDDDPMTVDVSSPHTLPRRSRVMNSVVRQTLLNIGSCSKAFLSASVGILMDDYAHGRNNTPLPAGVTRFDWYSKVADILPDDWKLADEWASQKATFRDVLSHQTGLPR